MLLAVLLLSTYNLLADDIPKSQVSSVIINQFNADFPNARDVDWERERGLYQVSFELSWTKDVEVYYTPEGKQVKLIEELSKSEVPQKITEKISVDHKNYRIEDAYRIEQDQVVTYKVSIERWFSDDDFTLHFTEDGDYVNAIK